MGDQVGNKGSETPLERVAPLATVSTLATLDALKQLQSSIMAQMQLMHTGFLDAQENPLQVPGRLPQILLLSIHSSFPDNYLQPLVILPKHKKKNNVNTTFSEFREK
jgi:hypothetical protein